MIAVRVPRGPEEQGANRLLQFRHRCDPVFKIVLQVVVGDEVQVGCHLAWTPAGWTSKVYSDRDKVAEEGCRACWADVYDVVESTSHDDPKASNASRVSSDQKALKERRREQGERRQE